MTQQAQTGPLKPRLCVDCKGTRESALSQPSGISYAIPAVHVKEVLARPAQR